VARKQYVTFYLPGVFLSEETTRAVESRDVGSLDIPEYAFAFQFWEREEIEQGGEVLKGSKQNVSGRHYPGARLMDVADVLVEEPNNRILVANMEGNGWERVVRTRAGNYQPYNKGDVILAEPVQ
jgi:hypothetical protein